MLTKMVTHATIASLVLVFLAGCSSTKVSSQFWPPPPDEPRIQFLKGIADSTDVVPKKSISLLELGQEKPQDIPLIKPYGLAVSKGVLYICDTMLAQVVIFDLPGQKASVLSGNKGVGQLKKPTSVAVDDQGFIYVSDTVHKQVLKYAPDGAFVAKIGQESVKPVGVAVDDLYLYILDSASSLVRMYDRVSAAPVRSFGQEGDERGRLFTPLGIGLDGKGGVYVTNMDGRIIKFDRDGHPLVKFGRLGSAISEFNRPRSITFDKDGIMYVADAASQNVRLMTDKFQILMSFGEPGTRGSLNVPAGVSVSDDNVSYYQQFADPDFVLEKVIFAVSQFGDNKINIYGLGKKKGIDYDAVLKERMEQIRKKEESIDKEIAARELREKEEKEKLEKAARVEGKSDTAGPAADGKK